MLLNRSRNIWCGLTLAASALVAFTETTAQVPLNPTAAKPKIAETAVETEDGWQIAITYYESDLGRDAPVVLLLHGKGGNRLAWKNGLAERLQDEGYAVVSVDLRKHGESTPPQIGFPRRTARARGLTKFDYERMVVADLPAAKKFIYEQHQAEKLNMRKLAIVAADMTAPVAVNFALADWLKRPYNDAPTLAASTPRGQDVRAIVLISPDATIPGVPAGPALLKLRQPVWNVAFLIAVGDKDSTDRGQAAKLYEQLTGVANNDSRMYLKNYDYKFRGTDLLGQDGQLEAHILAFLERHLKSLPDGWRNRESRLTAP